MEDKKRRHHYVFQAYLKAWGMNEQVWCLREGKIFKANTVNIAQERDFYRIQPLNLFELKFFMLLQKKAHPKVRKEMLNHIITYLSPIEWQKDVLQFKQFLKENFYYGEALPLEIEEEFIKIEKQIDIGTNNIMEDYLSEIEGDGVRWIELLLNKDRSFYCSNDNYSTQGYFDDDQFHFLLFVSIQYFRTKAMKERWINNFKPALEHPDWHTLKIPKEKICLDNLHPHFMWQFQTACAYALRSRNAHLTLLVNATELPFITSDQPVINIEANYNNLDEETTELIFYYPISPNIAITINDKNIEDIMDLNIKKVDEFNRKILNSAYQNIFSNSKEILECYCK